MKIGIFDSGLGGLIIAKELFKKLPIYDYIYLGDTKNLPYGNKSQEQIFQYTSNALRYLFAQDCKLVIIACNTSSAKALRKIQQQFLPKYFPDRKVLGVIVPTLEVISSSAKKVGVVSTSSTAKSHAYKKELAKLRPKILVYEQAAPKLVQLIESDKLELAPQVLRDYLKPLLKKNIDTLILGCTHYPILKKQLQFVVGKKIKIISQEEIIPGKLQLYLKKHREINKTLSKLATRQFLVTKINKQFQKVAKKLFSRPLTLKKISL